LIHSFWLCYRSIGPPMSAVSYQILSWISYDGKRGNIYSGKCLLKIRFFFFCIFFKFHPSEELNWLQEEEEKPCGRIAVWVVVMWAAKSMSRQLFFFVYQSSNREFETDRLILHTAA
jgi:hypothetical protein